MGGVERGCILRTNRAIVSRGVGYAGEGRGNQSSTKSFEVNAYLQIIGCGLALSPRPIHFGFLYTLFTYTKKHSPYTGARANNTLQVAALPEY